MCITSKMCFISLRKECEVFLLSQALPLKNAISSAWFIRSLWRWRKAPSSSNVVRKGVTLLCGGEFAEGRRDEADDDAADEVPREEQKRALPADLVGEFAGEEDDVEDGLGEVGVEEAEGAGPFVDILGDTLVVGGDAGVEVGDFVVVEVGDVMVVDVVGEASAVAERQSPFKELDAAGDQRRRERDQGQC